MPERLTECLIRRRLLDPARAREAIERQVLLGGALDTCLLELRMISEPALVDAMSAAYGLPTATARQVTSPVDDRVCRAFPEQWAKKHGLAPLAYEAETRVLTVLSPAPPDMHLLARLGDLLEVTISPLLAPEYRVHERLALLYGDAPEERFRALMELRTDSPVASSSSPGLESPLVSAGVARLQEAQDRDEIVQIALEYGHAELELVAMFIVHERRLEGFGAMGVGAENVGSSWLPLNVDSAFRRVLHTQTHHFGPLPDDTVHGDLLARLGRTPPRTALILPVKIRTRTVALMYGDNGPRPISPRLAADLITLSTHIQAALERLLVRRKSSSSTSEGPPTSTQDLEVMLSEGAPGRPLPVRLAPAPAPSNDAALDEAIAAQSREPVLGTEDPEALEAMAASADYEANIPTETGRYPRPLSERERRLANEEQVTADAYAVVDAYAPTNRYSVVPLRSTSDSYDSHPRAIDALRAEATREAYNSRDLGPPPDLASSEAEDLDPYSLPAVSEDPESQDPYAYDPFPASPPAMTTLSAPLAPTIAADPYEPYEPYVSPSSPDPQSGSGEWRAIVFEHHGPSNGKTPAPVVRTTPTPSVQEAWPPAPVREAPAPEAPSDEDEWASVAESLAGDDAPPRGDSGRARASSSTDAATTTLQSVPVARAEEPAPPAEHAEDPEASFARLLDTGSIPAPAPESETTEEAYTAAREGFIDAAPEIESEAIAAQPETQDEPDTRYEPEHESYDLQASAREDDDEPVSAPEPEHSVDDAQVIAAVPTTASADAWDAIEVTSWEQWANSPGPRGEGAPPVAPEPETAAAASDVDAPTAAETEGDGWSPVTDVLESTNVHRLHGNIPHIETRPDAPVPLTRLSSRPDLGEPVPLTRPSSRASSRPGMNVASLRAESTAVDNSMVEAMRSISENQGVAAESTGLFVGDPNLAPEESGSLPPPGSEDLFTDSDRALPAGASEDLLAESPETYAPSSPHGSNLPPPYGAPFPATNAGPPLMMGTASTFTPGMFAPPLPTPYVPTALPSSGSSPGYAASGSSPGLALSASSPGFVTAPPGFFGAPETGSARSFPAAYPTAPDAPVMATPTRPRVVEGNRPEVPPLGAQLPPAAAALATPQTSDIDRAAQFEFEVRGLIATLESFDKAARRRAKEALISLGPDTLPMLMERYPGILNLDPFSARTQLLPPITECGDLLAVLAALGPDAHTLMVKKLDGPDPLQRLFATHFYGSVFAPEVIPRLVQRLHDEEPRISMLAARTLYGYRDVPEFQVVLEHLHGRLKATSVAARKHAAQLLGVFHDPSAVPFLIDVLERKERTLFEVVEGALEEITKQRLGSNPKKWRAWWAKNEGRPRMAWLIDGLSAKEVELRRSCAEELRSLTGIDLGYDEDAPRKNREDARLRWVRWWNEQHRLHKGSPNGSSAPRSS